MSPQVVAAFVLIAVLAITVMAVLAWRRRHPQRGGWSLPPALLWTLIAVGGVLLLVLVALLVLVSISTP